MGRKGITALVLALSVTGGLIALRLRGEAKDGGRSGDADPPAVEVAPIERGTIELRRTFTGTLEARGRFVVAANVGGRVERLLVDLADPVRQGQVVAELDDREQSAGLAEAAAEVAVMRANLAEARSALDIAERQLERARTLNSDGLMSDAELDLAKSEYLARVTKLQVAEAQLKQGAAVRRLAHIQSTYTKVVADWGGDTETRVVAERHVAEGDTVAPNDPLITVVDLKPLIAVVHVTERDYGSLRPKQQVTITTKAYPDRSFTGTVSRIAPVFRQGSGRARLEVEIANSEDLLKPGMFVRAEFVLDRVEDATIVPLAAVADRGGEQGVFVVDQTGSHVVWHKVDVGIRQGDRIQLRRPDLEGWVVTLGQQLIDDQSAITIPAPAPADSSEAE